MQADYFARLLQACLDVPRCVSYTVWGFTDAHSWVPSTFTGQGAATPFDEQLQPKPAYFALSDALRQRPKEDAASP
jgi:endo-1,4-beta-xylanase